MIKENGNGRRHWISLGAKIYDKRFHSERFVLSPLRKGQAEIIAIALRRALLGEIEEARITLAVFQHVHVRSEYSTLFGIQESVHEILMNLRDIILRSNRSGIYDASISARGPGNITAKNILLPPSVEIVDTTQHIATLTEPVELHIQLRIEYGCGYRTPTPGRKNETHGIFPINALFMPVRKANYSIHSYGKKEQEILFLEISMNGGLTPRQALCEASRKLLGLFLPVLDIDEKDLGFEDEEDPGFEDEEDLDFDPKDNQNGFPSDIPTFSSLRDKLGSKMALRFFFVDQIKLTRRLYRSLKKSNIDTLWDLLNLDPEELAIRKIPLSADDLKRIIAFLKEHSLLDEDEDE